MIKNSEIQVKDIISLWQNAFGDSEEDINYFADNVKHAECFVRYDCKNPIAMLYVVDCIVNDKKCKYIYAACTDSKYRNKGCMTALLDYVKNIYKRICLIPAENWLVDYYTKRGFSKKIEIGLIKFSEKEEIIEYLFDGCSLDNPFALVYEGE